VLLTRLVDVVFRSSHRSRFRTLQVRSILLVRPNFRIGNALLLTAGARAPQRFPTATLDVLIGDIPAVLRGLPIDRPRVTSIPVATVGLRGSFLRLRRSLRSRARRRHGLAVRRSAGSPADGAREPTAQDAGCCTFASMSRASPRLRLGTRARASSVRAAHPRRC
jgi:hypothetical protein